MKLSIITLTLNKLDYTKKFIKSLFEYTKDFELIIVDNGSTDGTVEYLETLDNIKLIKNSENKGFSAGSYKDLTRVAYLNEDMWTELFMDNKKFIKDEIDTIISELQKYSDALEKNDYKALRALLKEGKERKELIDR